MSCIHTIERYPEAESSRAEGGFITVVIVLMMLILITIVGISAINMAMIESSIVRTDGLYKRNFYLAESAAYEAAQRLENTPMTETNPTGGVASMSKVATLTPPSDVCASHES